ncbi:MAG: trypsin-like peptidase domain-containing protein [Phycisphaerales bacterium JB065]
MPMRLSFITLSLAIAAGLHAPAAQAQDARTAPMGGDIIESRIDSGFLHATARDAGTVVFQTHVHEPGAAWIRLRFEDVQLPGVHGSGTESVLRLTSMLDGAVQELDAIELMQWQNSSAYFNGDTVLIEVVNRGTAGVHNFRMSEFVAGPDAGVPAEVQRSICFGIDDRELSDDPRVARIAPIGCTGWMIDDCNNCFLTAGHCTGSGSQVVQFNVPLSNPNGSWNNPHPDDQYAIDQSSMQSNGGQGIGNDWAYFGAFPNSNTGLRPAEAQGDYFELISPPAVTGQPIRVTGYGTVSSPVPGTWNSVQKTHVGPFAINSGNRIGYTTDTTGGNSGSPVILDSTGQAIGIHTHAGCGSSGGANNGTSSRHPSLQDALANPLGVCCGGEPEPPAPFDLLYPADEAEAVERNPVMSWQAADNTWYYKIWVADNPELQDAVVDGFQTANTQISLPPNYLDEGTTYYWQVEAMASNGLTRLGTPQLATFTTVGSLVPCLGDTDGNGSIDLADLNAVLATFGATGGGEGSLEGDVDGNGSVDLADLNIVLAAFGTTCP